MKVGALFIIGIANVSADVANPHASELAEFQEVQRQRNSAIPSVIATVGGEEVSASKCTHDGECCPTSKCTRCCSGVTKSHYTLACPERYRCGPAMESDFDTVGLNTTALIAATGPTPAVSPDPMEAPKASSTTLTGALSKCIHDGHCCEDAQCDTCCSRDNTHTQSCNKNGVPRKCGASADAADEMATHSALAIGSGLVDTPKANKTAPQCVKVNQCTTSCANCCSTYGHHTHACAGDHVHAGCRCDSGPAAPQQLEAPRSCVKVNHCCLNAAECCTRFAHYTAACGAGCRCDHSPPPQVPEPSAPAAPQNLEESKPDVTCFHSGACFEGGAAGHGQCLDRCCSGQCEPHAACGGLEKGGWRCKGKVQDQGHRSNASLPGDEPQPLEPATLAGEALQEMDQFNPRTGLATQCLGDGQCCEEYNCNLCCTGKFHSTMACGMQRKRCGTAADSGNLDEMVV